MKRIIIGIYVDETIERLQQTLVALRANTPETHETLLLLNGAEAVTREAAVTVQGVELSATPDAFGAPARRIPIFPVMLSPAREGN